MARREREMADRKDWERAGGVVCPRCSKETVRLIGGLCPRCWLEKESKRIEKQEDKTMRRHYKRRLREGTISLPEMREGGL